ncbi:hypothetical protein EVB94_060 [Rhizobium phage RHph_TM40]|nr:hypothetical protein EVB94_060 [Rhizobium phage RHph_TM40]QIG72256.1 hypothetical protein EVB96_060 [Rhizobium phage RHph_TM3_3_6]
MSNVFLFKSDKKAFEDLCEQLEDQDVQFHVTIITVNGMLTKSLTIGELVIAALIGEESHIYLTI